MTVAERKYRNECLKAYEAYETVYRLKDRVPDAIWDFDITLPDKPSDPSKIINFGKPKEERKFPLMSKEEIDGYEALATSDAPIDKARYSEFVKREWHRRLNGLFFFNGDKLEYITGWNYVWLQYWWIPGPDPKTRRIIKRRPMFMDAQRDVFYIADFCRKHRKTAGFIWLSFRRFGKSALSMFMGFMDTTENEKAEFNLQHKTEKSGITAFRQFIISGWKDIPIWFKPQDTGQTSYAKGIKFDERTKMGSKHTDRIYGDVLGSSITVMDSKEGAVDSLYSTWFVRDEAAKVDKNIDIEESWNVTRETLFVSGVNIGTAIITSTAEDMEKYGSDGFLRIWNASDTKNLLPNGYTESYLFRLFIPAYYGFMGEDDDGSGVAPFMDEWGYSDAMACKAYHEEIESSLSGNALLSRKRKFPLNFQDAWLVPDSRNNFKIYKLVQQKIYNGYNPNFVRGNYEWKNGIRDGVVIWRPCDDGKWLKISSWMPHETDINAITRVGGLRTPSRTNSVIGVDPFSHATAIDHGSMGAAVQAVESDPYNTGIREALVCMYHFREKEPHLMAEDIIMQAVFTSSRILPERNTYGFIEHVKMRGYEGYLMKDPLETDPRKLMNSDYGFPNSDPNKREALMTITGSWITDRMGVQEDGGYGVCPFNDLLDQLILFDVKKWTKFDLAVATFLAILGIRAPKRPQPKAYGLSDWVPRLNEKIDLKQVALRQAMTGGLK